MTLIVKPGFNGMTDTDAIAYVNAVEAADGQLLEFGVGKAINDFVVGCKLDGTWSAIKASCILSGARTRTGALVPLVGTAPTSFNFVDANYDRKTGLVGDGSTKYLSTNRANDADPQNNKHISVYLSQAPSSTGSFQDYISASTGVGNTGITRASAGTSGTVAINNNNANATLTNSAINTVGFIGASRSSASDFISRTLATNTTNSLVSATPASTTITVFRRGSASSGFSNAGFAFYSIGESLDLALLDARVTALITAFGVAIP
jgi:hypothetical protein